MAKHKRKHTATVHKPKHDEQTSSKKSFSLKSPQHWKKYLFSETVLIIVLILIAISVSVHYRMGSSHLDVTQDWALDSYKNQIRASVAQQVQAQYPNLPQANRDQFVNQQINEIIEQQADTIQPQIDQTADYFKSRLQDEHGNTYLLAIDPYLWHSTARNYLNNGHFGDEIVDGKPSFSLRDGRNEQFEGFRAHSFFIVQVYKLTSIFDSDFTLQRAAFLTPVIIIALSIIPAFFLGRKVGGNLAGFIAGILIATNAPLLGRTAGGFSDTDAYIILFPLLVTWLFFEALTAKKLEYKITYSGLSGLAIVLFMLFWGEGWHIGTILLGVAGLYFIYRTIINWKTISKDYLKAITVTESGKTILLVLTFIISTMLSGALIGGLTNNDNIVQNALRPMERILLSPLGAFGVKDVASTDIWPNVLTTVAELNSGSWPQIINSLGGKLFFGIAILGALITLTIKTDDKKIEVRYIFLLSSWFFGLTLASLISSRFIALLAAPFAIAFGTAFGVLFNQGSIFAKKQLKINPYIPKVLVIVVLGFLLADSFVQADRLSDQQIPSMTDAWYDTLITIKEDTQDGIITSWWDFGHWFVNVAQRRVTFDGGNQGKRIHWVGKLLMTPDIKENRDILRMLNCGQNRGYEYIREKSNNSYTAINTLNEIIPVDREEADQILESQGFSLDERNRILEKTHCEDVLDQYVIASQDMIGKAGVWAHFGSWNFTRANIYNIVVRNDLTTAVQKIRDLGFSQEEAEQFYFEAISLTNSRQVDSWVSPWPSYITTNKVNCNLENSTVICPINRGIGTQQGQQIVLTAARVDLEDPSNAAYLIQVIGNGQIVASEEIIPPVVSIGQEEVETIYLETDGSFPYELFVVEENGNYNAIIADELLARSAFTKLFFFDGKYMDGYEKLADSTTFTGQRIITYKVDLTS